MTIPVERLMSVVNTEKFLVSLCRPKETPGVPRVVRERAKSLLRHYPNEFYMQLACEQAPDIFNNK